MPKKRQYREFEIMQYYEYFDETALEKIFNWLDKLACKYLCVKHDKDDKAPHFHLFVKMENARTFQDIARQCDIKQQYIQKIEKGFRNAVAYAFHLTETAKDDGKYIYDASAVIKSRDIDINAIFEKNKKLEEEKLNNEQIRQLFYDYGECNITKDYLIKNIDAKIYEKNALLMKKMREYRQLKVRDRNMQVIFICGESGSGKTTCAKYFAKLFHYDVFVSGSGKDLLDGYDKQECIILDDLRGDAFTKAELFKLTDNNTNSSVKSRYNNKDISYCKLMVITSIYPPHKLYNWLNNEEKDEAFKQFTRRLNYVFLYIHDNGEVWECKYDDPNDPLSKINKSRAPFNMQMIFQVLGIERAIGKDTMQKIYDLVVSDIVEQQDKTKDGDDLPF